MEDRFKFKAFHKKENRVFEVYSFTEKLVMEVIKEPCGNRLAIPHQRVDCELLQCTGKPDIHGTLIYENFLLKDPSVSFEDYPPALVKFDPESAAFVGQGGKKGEYFDIRDFMDMEIIGDIYNNHEIWEEWG